MVNPVAPQPSSLAACRSFGLRYAVPFWLACLLRLAYELGSIAGPVSPARKFRECFSRAGLAVSCTSHCHGALPRRPGAEPRGCSRSPSSGCSSTPPGVADGRSRRSASMVRRLFDGSDHASGFHTVADTSLVNHGALFTWLETSMIAPLRRKSTLERISPDVPLSCSSLLKRTRSATALSMAPWWGLAFAVVGPSAFRRLGVRGLGIAQRLPGSTDPAFVLFTATTGVPLHRPIRRCAGSARQSITYGSFRKSLIIAGGFFARPGSARHGQRIRLPTLSVFAFLAGLARRLPPRGCRFLDLAQCDSHQRLQAFVIIPSS